MRSIHYSSIVLLLILQIGIKAEPPSSSFVNLIPNIIANGQFIQEYIIDSNILFNQTSPWVDVDLTLDTIGSNCSREIQLLARDFRTRQTWALKSKFCFSL
jgi:hypothetical protein